MEKEDLEAVKKRNREVLKKPMTFRNLFIKLITIQDKISRTHYLDVRKKKSQNEFEEDIDREL